MDIELPKRDDAIYKEIESFEDYEFTNCVAYEMMIRNPQFLKDREYLKTELISLFHQDKITKDDLWKFSDEKDYGVSFFDMAHTDNLNRGFFTPNTITTEVLINGQNYLNIEKKETDLLETKINVHLSRPKLRFRQTKRAVLKLNFALPKEELIAYIEKIKDEYDKDNSLIKSSLELLGKEFEKTKSKKINKSKIADKFFIYDYVTVMQEQIKEDNEFKYEEYNEQIQEINSNPYITPKDRKIQLKELKREFEENTNIRKNEIFEDIEKFTSATTKRYYYDIKPFIDDFKYKELITGIKTN